MESRNLKYSNTEHFFYHFLFILCQGQPVFVMKFFETTQPTMVRSKVSMHCLYYVFYTSTLNKIAIATSCTSCMLVKFFLNTDNSSPKFVSYLVKSTLKFLENHHRNFLRKDEDGQLGINNIIQFKVFHLYGCPVLCSVHFKRHYTVWGYCVDNNVIVCDCVLSVESFLF